MTTVTEDPAQDPLEALEARLRESGVEWTVARQTVPSLPVEPPPDIQPSPRKSGQQSFWSKMKSFMRAESPLASIDWRQRGLAPLKHQGSSRACTAHAIASVLEDHRRLASPPDPVILDALHAHVCIGGKSEDQAWDECNALEALKTFKIPRQPALSHAWDTAACTRAQGHLGVRNIRALEGANAVTMAKAELQDGPILAVMDLWEDFHNFYGGGVYRHKSGKYHGLHAVEVVGFNGDGWLVRNSYGTGWGDQGFACVAFGECRLLQFPAYAFRPR